MAEEQAVDMGHSGDVIQQENMGIVVGFGGANLEFARAVDQIKKVGFVKGMDSIEGGDAMLGCHIIAFCDDLRSSSFWNEVFGSESNEKSSL